MLLLGILGVIVGIAVVGVVGGVIWGIGSSSGWWGKGRGLPAGDSPARPRMGASPRPAGYLDAEGQTDPGEILATVEPRMSDPILGPYAMSVSESLSKADFQRDGIYTVMEREFGEGSLTWDKFSVPVDMALDGIRSNAARMANRMRGIDSGEYLRLSRLADAGAVKPGTSQEASLAATKEALAELDRLSEANDRMLAELDKLQAELSNMSGAHEIGTTDEIVEELRTLSNDAKEYA